MTMTGKPSILAFAIILMQLPACDGHGSKPAGEPEGHAVAGGRTGSNPDQGAAGKPAPEQDGEILPPEHLWSPKELGIGKPGRHYRDCFPSTDKDYGIVVARAGEMEILVKDFTSIFHTYTLDATKPDLQDMEARRDLVDELLDQELLAWAARQRGLDSTQTIPYLAKRELANKLRKQLRDQARAEVGEETAKQFYKSHPEKYRLHPDQRRIAQILMKGKKTAQTLIAGFRPKGVSVEAFVKNARSMSIDPDARTSGGRTDWFDREGMIDGKRIVPENVASAAFKLKKRTDVWPVPLSSSAGWHVIQLLGEREQEWIPFKKVGPTIVDMFVAERQQTLVDKLLDNIKKSHSTSVNLKVLELISPVPCM